MTTYNPNPRTLDDEAGNEQIRQAAPAIIKALEELADHAQYMYNMYVLDQAPMKMDYSELFRLTCAARAALNLATKTA